MRQDALASSQCVGEYVSPQIINGKKKKYDHPEMDSLHHPEMD